MIVNNIDVTIIRKKIKNAHLYVKPPYGNVEVTCPENYSDENVRLFVITKLSWIKRQQESFQGQLRQSEREYVSGETVFLFGKQYYLQVDYSSKGYKIIVDVNKIKFIVRQDSTVKQREKQFNEWFREKLNECLKTLVPKCESKTGIKSNGYKIINMKSKWGSCTIDKRIINLNLQLVKKDYSSIEYVVIHELIHLIDSTHGPKFINLMNGFIPNWKEIRDNLNSQTLEKFK